MFQSHVEEKQTMENLPIASIQFHLNPMDDEKIVIHRDNVVDNPNIRQDLYEEINRIVLEAERILQPSNNDRIGVIIVGRNQDNVEIRIGIPYRIWNTMSADIILHNIEQKLNSAETLFMQLTFTFSIRYSENNFNLGKKVGWNGDNLWYTTRKRCITQIHPEKDPFKEKNDCIWQFLILGYAFIVSKSLVVSKIEWINVNTYKLLVSSSSKFKKRHEFGLMLKSIIQEHDFTNIITEFERVFEVRIVLYSLTSFLNVEYPLKHLLPFSHYKVTFFGLVTTQKDGTWEHVDLITNPTALSLHKSECTRLCYFCFEVYSRIRNCGNINCINETHERCIQCHTCSGVCISCFNVDCELDLTFLKSCSKCNVKFRSQICQNIHEELCQNYSSKQCSICFRKQHRGLKCNEYNCMLCGYKETFENKSNHKCYLKKQKLKKKKDNYWTYDFETCLNDTSEHKLYLCTCTPLYWKESYEILKEKYNYKEVKNYIVFYFWDMENVYNFFDFVSEDVIHGSTFFAHNAGKYDSIFIEKYMFERKKLHCKKIQQGLRLMQLYYEQIDVTFKDSLLFIPTSLRSMSKDFGVKEFKKGFFPHKIMSFNYFQEAKITNYIVPTPCKENFEEDLSFYTFSQEKKELDLFLNEFLQKSFWNLKEDSIDYCISDTLLLAEVLKTFREKTFEITSNDFDVLNYVTLPSAVMKYYLSAYLPEKTIGIIDRYSSLIKREEKLWILWLQYTTSTPIIFQNECEGCFISAIFGKNCYIFHPCYDHGCKYCYRGSYRNFRNSKTFNETFLYYKNNEDQLKLKGYTVISIWEHSWMKMKEESKFELWINENYFEIENQLPLDPREAYKGGVSECYKFSVKKHIQMVDFVSQYPTSLLGSSFCPYTNEKLHWYLPIGIARNIDPLSFCLSDKLSIVKCKVLPPRQLYAPFLGYKATSILSGTYEVLYGLCRACMNVRNLKECTHTNNEREIIGTWTSVELHYAISIGYEITKIIDVWEYNEKTNLLFTDFITPFMITKILSKKDGIVENMKFTNKGEIIVNYVKDVCGKELKVSEFDNKPAERVISKLMMNSFYGKWGQRSSWPETIIFSSKEVDKCLKILSNPSYKILHGQVFKKEKDTYVVIEYEKDIASVKGDASKNDHIAAFVTAYGRIMLNKLIQKLGDQIIYSDTDSAFLIKEMELPFQTGFRIGDLELELKDGYNWSALGRKSYSFESENNVVCKQKGISLKQSMRNVFNPDYLRKLLFETKQNFFNLKRDYNESQNCLFKRMKKQTEDGIFNAIVVQQRKFVTVKESSLTMTKQSVIQNKKTCFLLWGLKRVPCWENEENDVIDSLPFGYCK